MGRSEEALAKLLEERIRAEADHAAIDERIWQLFGERWCVLFTDMAGFSRRAARAGIVPFLVLIHQMRRLVGPIWEEHAGLVLKDIADSQLVLFRDPRAALAACIDAQRAVSKHNEQTVEADRIYLGCGLGWGEILKLGDEDVYGVEVNFAAKLGEDLAGPYDIFLTPDCVKAIGKPTGAKFSKVKGGRLGGTHLGYFKAEYDRVDTATKRAAKKQRVKFK